MIRIGTRGSPLALWQARQVQSLLMTAHGLAESAVEIVPIVTTGDRITDRKLSEIGGKGLFTKEIEEGLLDGSLDLAVHSLKDVATEFPDGLGLTAVLEREDPRDCLIAKAPMEQLADLPHGAVVGTASLRRGAQMLNRRPDLTITPLRGNVGTRLEKIERGDADATLLALAGLKRLGLADKASLILDEQDMLPALCQGIVGIETRLDDTRMAELLRPINHWPTWIAAKAERALLAALDGSCRTPMAGLARLDHHAQSVCLEGAIFAPDGSMVYRARSEAALVDAEALGSALGAELKHDAGEAFLAQMKEMA